MKRENLVTRLGKRFLPYILIGALAFSTLFNYKCANEFVEPEPEKPVAMLIAQPTEGDAPLEVSFDGSLSYAHEGDLEKYLWDFDGDGNTEVTSEQAYINYIYEQAGEFNASLVVVDNQGQRSNKASEKITVTENIVSLGQIAFWSMTMTGEVWPQDIYSGDITVRVRDDNIELVGIKRLTTAFPAQDFEPAWSPDGEEIVFTSNRDGKIRLYTMNADGTEQTILTHNIDYASAPDWSPDGTKIAFCYRYYFGLGGIAVINLDGSGLEYLVEEESYLGGSPSWSPDGNWITFVTKRDGNMEVYKVEVNNKENQINLTNNPDYDVQPDWSPDGSRIAFVSDPNPYDYFYELEIYLINPDGSNKIQLTSNSAKELSPDWSPDGTTIIFTRRESDATTQDIWIINADGTNERKVFEAAESHDGFPAWRPKIED